jgi:hypothetical protein
MVNSASISMVGPSRDYTIHFFDGEIDRGDQCWILGWFWSDGNVSKTFYTSSESILHNTLLSKIY